MRKKRDYRTAARIVFVLIGLFLGVRSLYYGISQPMLTQTQVLFKTIGLEAGK